MKGDSMNRDEQMFRDLGCFFVIWTCAMLAVGLLVGAALVVIFREGVGQWS